MFKRYNYLIILALVLLLIILGLGISSLLKKDDDTRELHKLVGEDCAISLYFNVGGEDAKYPLIEEDIKSLGRILENLEYKVNEDKSVSQIVKMDYKINYCDEVLYFLSDSKEGVVNDTVVEFNEDVYELQDVVNNLKKGLDDVFIVDITFEEGEFLYDIRDIPKNSEEAIIKEWDDNSKEELPIELAIIPQYIISIKDSTIVTDSAISYGYVNKGTGLVSLQGLKELIILENELAGCCCSCCPDLKPGESCITACCPCK